MPSQAWLSVPSPTISVAEATPRRREVELHHVGQQHRVQRGVRQAERSAERVRQLVVQPILVSATQRPAGRLDAVLGLAQDRRHLGSGVRCRDGDVRYCVRAEMVLARPIAEPPPTALYDHSRQPFRPRSGGDDREVGVGVVDQGHQPSQDGGVAGDVDAVGLGGGQELQQLGLGQGDR